MSETTVLFFSVCAVCAVALAFVAILPWFTKKTTTDNRLMELNVRTFYRRLDELQQDKDTGAIASDVYDAQAADLKRQLLAAQSIVDEAGKVSQKSRLTVLFFVPFLAALAYALLGDRTAVFEFWRAQDTVGQVADDLMSAKIDAPPEWAAHDTPALMSAVQSNVHRHAMDADRWMRLSEVYLKFQANRQALTALSRAYRLRPDDDEIAGTYAQVRFFANNGQLDNDARKVLARMLSKNPNHEGALMLLAMGETQAGNYEAARRLTTRLRSQIAAKSGDRRAALASLDEMLATIDKKAQQAHAVARIDVRVDPTLLGNLTGEETLFVSLSDPNGGPPYAVYRGAISDLQGDFVSLSLGDDDAMLPNRALSDALQAKTPLVANAKISLSGNAIAQSGDLVASAQPWTVNATTTLVIDAKMP